MKIYDVAFFLLVVNLSISYIGSCGILPVNVATMAMSEEDFKGSVPDDISYSNADIGLYLFGDFPRALGMLAKIFILAPVTLALLLGEVGMPGALVTMFGVIVWAIYLAGMAQVIMKFSLSGGE